ncbi:MAG TPA: hypothetical protein VJ696_07885 [Rhodanobacteraceae bacterium]|nr:hypothetical protein [Rhodanobacteraceae bacterium]
MRRPFALVPILLLPLAADAASTVALPPWLCGAEALDVVFRDGFDASWPIPHDPSGGSGGQYPGDVPRVISVPGAGVHILYLHIPTAYSPSRAWPLLIALHGTSGSSGTAPAAAQQIRDDWSGWSESRGFLVVAPVASGPTGSWEPDVDIPAIYAAIADTAARYNVERTRIDVWGYSAGGHVAHGLVLNDTGFFAAYGVSAGSLTQYACTDDGSIPPSCAALLSGAEPKTPVDIHLGNHDPLYLQYGAGDDPARFEAGGWIPGQDLFYTLFPGGHIYTVAQLGEIWTNICPFAVGP